MSDLITGIQQCGIGVSDAKEAALYYKEIFGFNAVVFDDTAEAYLMTRYTGDKIYKRRAMLTMNMQGGGGLELWQFTDRSPTAPTTPLKPGDLGINAIKIKCRDVSAAYDFFKNRKDVTLLDKDFAAGKDDHFWLQDKYENIFQLIQKEDFFDQGNHVCAGVCGAVIGVNDISEAINFYGNLLGLLPKGDQQSRENYMGESITLQQQTLYKPAAKDGAFAELLGDTEIELLKATETKPVKIYKDRFWGDLGFIHLCFDVLHMTQLKTIASKMHNPFTVDSDGCFDMEKAGGRFCYVEDPDGTLIELVQTHKIPVVKKLGLFLNLHKRKNNKPLPRYVVKMLGLNKLK